MSRTETESFLYAIARTIDDIIACAEAVSPGQLNTRLPTEGGNSLYIIATHVMANAEQNVLDFLCGQPVQRVRDEEVRGGGRLRRTAQATLGSAPAAARRGAGVPRPG